MYERNNKNIINYKNFLINILSKKNTTKVVKKKIASISSSLFPISYNNQYRNLARTHYILSIRYTSANTFVQLSNSLGRVLFYCSAGYFFKGKQKTSRFLALKKFINFLFLKFSFLQEVPLSLHFYNVFNKRWVIRYLKKKIFLISVKNFTIFAHNGCRNKKIKRKKFKKKLHLVYTN